MQTLNGLLVLPSQADPDNVNLDRSEGQPVFGDLPAQEFSETIRDLTMLL